MPSPVYGFDVPNSTSLADKRNESDDRVNVEVVRCSMSWEWYCWQSSLHRPDVGEPTDAEHKVPVRKGVITIERWSSCLVHT